MWELAMITGDQIRQARKLLGWHRGQIAIRARGITGNTVGKAEGAFPGKPPSLEELAEIPAVLEAAGVEFQHGDPAGMRLKSPAPPRAL
jgi:transcriptional regulator with XRE-family HTH domain